MTIERLGVIGGGAWGTALAQVAASGGRDVPIWVREDEARDQINTAHENRAFLPGVALSPTIRATADLADLSACGALLVVTPAQHLRAVLAQLPASGQPLLLCAKGIEAGSGLLMADVAREIRPASPLAVLSGPTFAHEVAKGLPTAITLACADEAIGQALVERLALPAFRPYWSPDVTGAEIGGAVKNVLAIACGVVAGRRLGENARAAVISRGFAEMQRFGMARGAQAATLAGLSGLGDLVLTCSSTSSRNFSLGIGLGEGKSAADLLANRNSVAEGAFTAPVLRQAALEAGVDMPIVAAVCKLLEGGDPETVVSQLLGRPLRREG